MGKIQNLQVPVKYQNHAQLCQGVCRVNEPTLEPTDRLFLNCLAAHTVGEHPHPGNDRLMQSCGVTTRQGLNRIADRVCNRHKLAEVVTPGGGRGLSTVYRICTEDPRFPAPKPKPATVAEE